MTHSTIALFDTDGDELLVGRMSVSRLAARIGSTPFFAYDRSLLSQRVGDLRAALPSGVKLSYAMKANPMPAVVQHLSGLVDGIDVASAGELHVALDTGISPRQVSFAGPGKTVAELRQAVASGVTIEIESAGEAGRVLSAGQSLGVRPQIAIRVNPDFKIKGSGMRMGGGPQQFGVDAEEVPRLLKELDGPDLAILGFHVFAGSQNLQADILCEAQRKTVELVVQLAQHLSTPVRYVNLGGGFGIPYFAKDRPIELQVVAGHLAALVDGVLARELPEARPVIELGRYLVGECGVYVTRVVDRKVSRGQTYLVVDGGLHHQLAASGNFGQVIRRNYPLAVANRMGRPADENVTVVGCLCTPLDLLGDKIDLPHAQEGDLVAIFAAGAYGLTASPNLFLGHPAPLEVLV